MPSNEELYWLIALTTVPGIGPLRAKALLEHFGTAQQVFLSTPAEIIRHRADYSMVDATLTFIHKYKIQTWCVTDPEYPRRLALCADYPTLLYFKGNAEFNDRRVLSVVGTRTPGLYGKQLVKEIVRDLAPYDVLILSGLADGIDGLAHRHALENGLSTVGVLGHGLDCVYPSGNRLLAMSMVERGGLLTEYRQGVGPETYHFPMRNRIVAAVPEATLIIESRITGGSMVTARLADGYGREVLAVPGRSTDTKSQGCNALIHHHIATLVTCGADIARVLRWDSPSTALPSGSSVPVAGTHCSAETVLLELLRDHESVHFDELRRRSGLSATVLATALLALELDQAIDVLPGKLYRLGS